MRFRVIVVVLGLGMVAAGCGNESSAAGSARIDPASETVGPQVLGTSVTAESTTTTAPLPETTTTTAPPPVTLAAPTTAPAATIAAGQASNQPAPTTAPAPAPEAPPITEPVAPPPPPPPTTTPPPPPPPPVPTGKPCIVSLHGKGGGGQGEWTGPDGVRHSFPSGNAGGWGGLQWLYYPESGYQAARNIVANDVAAGGCQRVIVKGFSNGAAFAAKLYCRGETFGGTVIGYVIDDPVVDHAVEGCARAPVRVVLYWTGGINVPDGWDCVAGDWTCEGNSAIGITRYEAAVGVGRTQSIYTDHRMYVDPPELHSWF